MFSQAVKQKGITEDLTPEETRELLRRHQVALPPS